MRAVLEQRVGVTRFVVADVEKGLAAHLLSFGFSQEADRFVRSFSGDERHLEAAFANFERSIEEMTLQHAGIRPVPWDVALQTFIDRVVDRNLDWALIGGTALAVRGVEVVPGDVDVVTDVTGAQQMDDLFLDTLIEPTCDAPGFGWFGRAFPEARLEWLGNPRDAKDVWSLGTVTFETVEWRGRPLRVPPLAVYERIEAMRGRSDRVEAIKRAMD
jgi:hypothetical protein